MARQNSKMTRLIDYFAVVGCQCDGEATVGLVFSYLRFTVQFNCSKHPLPQWYKYVINLPMDNPAFDHVCLLIFQEIFPVPERSFSVFLKSIGKTVHLHLASSWLVLKCIIQTRVGTLWTTNSRFLEYIYWIVSTLSDVPSAECIMQGATMLDVTLLSKYHQILRY